jgi:dihydrofolate synthase / folylpolyglutamate synthase
VPRVGGDPEAATSVNGTSDYSRAVAELGRALTFGIHPSLEGIRALTDALGRPQDTFVSVQVTGTNGKTSATRLIEAILRGEGFSAGAYTSPHLERYTERIEVSGELVSEEDFARGVSAALDARTEAADGGGGFTEFELLTAAALWLFRDLAVDFAVLEVGMGGRWDATSVVSPAVAVVTSVGLDHTDRLGTTVEEIAADKAHIIKPASTPVLGPGTSDVAEVFLERARSLSTEPLFVAEADAPSPLAEGLTVRFTVTERPTEPGGRLSFDVRGLHGDYPGLRLAAPSYQAPNAAVAIAAAEAALGRALDLEALRDSLETMTFPGRFEVVRGEPPLVIDGAHNPQAAAVLASAIDEAFGDDPPLAVIGVLRDKDADGIVAALAGHVAGFVCTQPDSARALASHELAVLVEEMTGAPCESYPRLADALAAVTARGTAVVVTGSLYTAGQAGSLLRGGGAHSRADVVAADGALGSAS